MTAPNEPQWLFTPIQGDDMARESVSEEFFKSTRIDSVVREAVQNSIDARAGDAPSVVRIYYSGEEAAIAADAYAPYMAGALEHYRHEGSGLTSLPAPGEKCAFLAIEDFHTTGLTGSIAVAPGDEEMDADRSCGNYHSFFFKENRGSKHGKNTLGSWGAGKITFQMASRLRTCFAYSVRGDAEAPRFLAGKVTLKSHALAETDYSPDGWYMRSVEFSGPGKVPARYRRKQAVTDAESLDRFAKLFRLARQPGECGTSLVIPYVNVRNDEGENEFTLENIAKVVIRNYLVALLLGQLEIRVKVGDSAGEFVINRDSLLAQKFSNYLPGKPENANSFVTRSHFDLVHDAVVAGLPAAQSYELKHVMPKHRPTWADAMFEGIDLRAVKKQMQEGKALRFVVPVTVHEKHKDGTLAQPADRFQVLVKKSANPEDSYRTAYYRSGLLVDAVARHDTHPGCVTVVCVPSGELAGMLVTTEPPSHSLWESSSRRASDNYAHVPSVVSYVINSVREILGRIEAADQEPDKTVLIGPFGIPVADDRGNDDGEDGGRDDSKDDDTQGGAPPPPVQAIPAPLLTISKLSGKTGFAVAMSEDRVSEKGYPFTATLRVGYVPFTKSSWSRFDFEFRDPRVAHEGPSSIAIDVSGAAADVVELVEAKDNVLRLLVKKPGGFRIELTGFDPNRNLEVSKCRYEYPQGGND